MERGAAAAGPQVTVPATVWPLPGHQRPGEQLGPRVTGHPQAAGDRQGVALLGRRRRASPSITCTRWRWDRPVSQSSTVEAAVCRRGSPAGAASSTSDTSRQWAPVHFR